MKRLLTFSFLFVTLCVARLAASPASWSFHLVDKGNGVIQLLATATIGPGWHMYDTEVPEGGPYATAISIDQVKGATPIGKFKAVSGKLHKEYDKQFDMQIGFYADAVSFGQLFKLTDKAHFVLKGDVRAQTCNDKECTPPTPVEFSFGTKDLPATLAVGAKVDTKADSKPTAKDTTVVKSSVDAGAVALPTIAPSDTAVAVRPESGQLWAPVSDQLKAYGAAGDVSNKSFWQIFVAGFIAGLIALVTPCVWPIIPMTVSFFLKRNKKNKPKAIKDAIVYGLAVIVIYLTLGLLVTAIFGASALNNLSTNAVFNSIFFVMLIVFAISFFGAFEIVLPSSLVNKIDSKADSTTGFISIFFMAFTLALVSFSCTGPIIGTLLVQAGTSGSFVAPAVGMFAFALALAIPFTLFAIFPSWLEGMPKSGGWLNSVKIVLAFLELALALKFLSVIDLAYGWHLLDREIFLSLWIVIFLLLGFYLLGKIRFPHDDEVKSINVTRLFLAIAPLSFALYMIPGLWGAPLKAISAFAPPLTTQDFSLYDGSTHAKFDDYEMGMEYARKNNKPVMLDFSGFACVNCRKMENSVWLDPRIKSMLEKDYVLISLMVDDKRPLPEVMEVVEKDGRKSKLKTIGDKWSYLQRYKFDTNSQPYYVPLDNSGKPIGPSRAYDENVAEYIKFLNIGLTNFKK